MDQTVSTVPPSPAPSAGEALPNGFGELVQHNASTSYPHDQLAMESIQAKAQLAPRYGTPVPHTSQTQTFDAPSIFPQASYGTHFSRGYSHPVYSHENSPYGPLPDDMHPQDPRSYSTPATSPPTPSRAADGLTTRSGTIVHRGSSINPLGPRSTRIEKAAPKKKKDRPKAAKKVAKLEKPLSELTKDWPSAVVDIDAYVNRSAEMRRREVEEGKVPGKIKRPMNAFMLYRKAYQNRAKEFCSQHNHQVVSQVCGDSWPLEPQEVREQFTEWARIERDNHQKAHPGYKFTPSKPSKATKPKRSTVGGGDDDSDASELDEFDWTGGRPGSSNRFRRPTPLRDPDADYNPPRSSFTPNHYGPVNLQTSPPSSSFHYSNPGRPMPLPYDHRAEMAGHYYQAQNLRDPHRQLGHGAVEDILMHRTPSPSMAFASVSDRGYDFVPYSATPPPMDRHHHQHLHHHGHPQEQPHSQHPASSFEHHIDPSLVPQDGQAMFESSFGNGTYFDGNNGLDSQQWAEHPSGLPNENDAHHATYSGPFAGLDETLLQNSAQTEILRGDSSNWHIEPVDGLPGDAWLDQPVPES